MSLRRSLALVRIVAVVTVLAVVVWSSSAARAAFPGENGDIAVNRSIGRMRVVSAEGVFGAKLGNGFDPAWSPDSSRIAFWSGNDIWTMAPDGSNAQLFASTGGGYSQPAWSPDGEHIVVSRYRDGNTELRVLSYPDSSSGATTLTHSPGIEENPVWSPDGTEIAYSYYICGLNGCSSRIAVSDLETSTHRFLTPKTPFANDAQPDWSPDGSTVVFASNRHNLASWWDYDVYTVPSDGGDLTRILTGKGRARSGAPVWSPDGTTLLYTHESRDGRMVLQSVRWDGTDKRTVLHIRFINNILYVPDWGALPVG